MKSFQQFIENFGGLPDQAPNYKNSARFPMQGADGVSSYKDYDLGQVHLHIVGGALQIDAKNHSVRLSLTSQQYQQLMSELQS